jgi:hypothetical protein
VIAQLAIFAAVFVLYFHYPVGYVRAISEDQPGEYAAFAAHLVACFFFARLLLAGHSRLQRLCYAALAAFTFLIAMEEISWGQRIFGVPTPDLLREVNFQGEIGIHNIRAISPDELTYLVVSLGVVAYGAVVPILFLLWRRAGECAQTWGLPVPSWHLIPLFLGTAYFLKFSGLVKGEEIGELLLGLSLGSLALDRWFSRSLSRPTAGIPARQVLAIPAYIAMTVILGVLLSFVWGSPGSFKKRLNSLARTSLPERGHTDQAGTIIAHLEKNPRLAEEDLLISKANLLMKTGRDREGMTTYQAALKLDLERARQNPDDHEIMLRLAQIHSEMGNHETAMPYWVSAMEAYEASLEAKNQKSDGTERRSRPEWTYAIWSREPTADLKKFKLHTFRASTFSKMGEYERSLEEYLEASNFAYNAKWKNVVMWELGRILSLCRYGDEGHKRRVPWDEVESMFQGRGEKTEEWCRSVNGEGP